MTVSGEYSTVNRLKNSAIQRVDARCYGVSRCSRRLQDVFNVSGCIIGEVSVMPPIYIQDKVIQMRRSALLSFSQRCDRLQKAGQLYSKAVLAGLDPEAYISLVSRATGLQAPVISKSLSSISYELCHMDMILKAATPSGAVWDHSDSAANLGCSLFSRRGEVVSIIAAGNGPGVHKFWPQAIAMGYRTLVKPSFREPFTAQRLVHAIEEAGLEEYVALIPTDHNGVEALITQSDLAIVYGGPDIVARYGNNPRVLVQGPGRSKIVVGKDICHEKAIKTSINSILSLGGAACVSASAILVEDSPDQFASRLSRELTDQSQDVLPTLARQQEAKVYEKLLKFDDIPWRYDNTSSQGFPLKPHVTVVRSASDPKVQRELPFPCVTIAPFSQENDLKALSNSLVVTLLSRQEKLISKVLADSSIANVYIGEIPTTWMDSRVPHDGYLADFLMCNRGLRIDPCFL